ncbi:tripartite tricarboxylate transporter substrate binding protein [Comamonas sp. AG1104]|uniref:Bug family tripartite tricarboxylate transporter substrate binding protein n=1 Tax=Comamonas sp. AG1104 TaxID=2183900 RepID=UPI000E0C25EC|nr:tripartite tricarboxylate transporter substrate binding protein [Comamonas sp. AG1104]RDI11399.1 tripartite-type tricarboxylate transporter receptor subunit TctC [Comamonas sp. AG1104]
MPSHAVSLNRRHLLAAGVLSSLSNASWSQTSHWPAKAVKFTVPFPPGGPVDTTARIFTQKLATMWNQAAIIDNRAGAGGVVGATAAAKDPADGYNFFVGSIHHAVNPWLMGKLSYDIEKDFVPVSFAALFPVFLVAHPSVPANNVKELIALSKKGTVLSYGSSGNGGGTHLAGELFNMEAGTQLQHIPYKGSAPAMTDLLGGQIQLMFADAPSALQHIRTGRIKVLGVASKKRSDMLPQVPTIAESGSLPNYEAYSWAALFAPARTPEAVLAKLNADFNLALSDPAVRTRLLEAGAEGDPGTPEEMRQRLKGELRKWQKVIQTAGIKAG